MIIDCPCIDCLCYSICKYKTFDALIDECKLVKEYISVTDSDPRYGMNRDIMRMRTLLKILKPELWIVSETKFKGEIYPIIQWTKKGIKQCAYRNLPGNGW